MINDAMYVNLMRSVHCAARVHELVGSGQPDERELTFGILTFGIPTFGIAGGLPLSSIHEETSSEPSTVRSGESGADVLKRWTKREEAEREAKRVKEVHVPGDFADIASAVRLCSRIPT